MVVARPEPCHIIMWEHDAFWITSCATSVNDVAAHARSLFGDTLEYHPIFDLASHLHDLTPVVNFYSFGSPILHCRCLLSRSFRKQEASFNTRIGQLLPMLIQIRGTKPLISVTHNNFCLALTDLFQTSCRTISQVDIWKNTICQNRSHYRR